MFDNLYIYNSSVSVLSLIGQRTGAAMGVASCQSRYSCTAASRTSFVLFTLAAALTA